MKKLYTIILSSILITSLNAQTALTFDGVDDYLDFGNVSIFAQSGDITVEAKVKTTTVLDYYPLVNNTTKDLFGFYEGYWLGVDDFGYATLFLGDAATVGDGYYVTGTTLIDDGQWHHISGTVINASSASPTAMLYVDGVLETTMSVPNLNIFSGGTFYVGADEEDYYHKGEIDNVRLWSRALSVTEINDNKDSCLAGTENGLVALYQFETGSGSSTVYDVTSNGNNGTMTLMDINQSWVTGFTCLTISTSITEANNDNSVDIYPNPFENKLSLQFSENISYPITLEVIDYLGRQVYTQIIEDDVIEIFLDKDIPTGTYFIKLFNEEIQTIERLIKVK